MKNAMVVLGAALSIFLMSVISANANLITNPGFETNEVTYISGHPGVPNDYGDWGGDYSGIVSSENGITPAEGSNMLRFLSTGNMYGSTLTASEIYQLIDVSDYLGMIQSGSAVASASALFNRVQLDDQTDSSFGLSIMAYSGNVSDFTTTGYIERISGGVLADADLSTWEMVSVSFTIPTQTSYLAIKIQTNENIFNDTGAWPIYEFDGHYADNISLEIASAPIPEPATMLLFGSGLVGFIGIRRRKK